MQGTKTPYGEARRLKYFKIMCVELQKSQSMNVDLFIDKVLSSARNINPKLKEYIRSTGIMQSRPVVRNYLRFAGWLNFLKIEGFLVLPNGYTIFLANLEGPEDFSLSNEEKIAFFLALIETDDLLRVLGTVGIKDTFKDSVKILNLSEHFVQSFFDWFVDLGILKPTSNKFGMFDLTNTGYHVGQSAKKGQKVEASLTYFSNLLSSPVKYGGGATNENIWKAFEDSLEKLEKHTRSEVDPNLYSAFPLVLDLQTRLIISHHLFMTATELIQKLKDISPNHNTIFSWDRLANAGFVKI